MPLTLRALSLNDRPLTQPMAARFDAEGGSIGRADHNTLALPDPERHISRHQAEIRADEGGYLIRNVGSANPIVVRGQPVARGDSTRLAHGDQIRIGAYLLEVLEDDGSAPGRAVRRPRASSAAPLGPGGACERLPHPRGGGDGLASSRLAAGAAPALSLATAFGPLLASNPFADLLDPPPPVAEPAGPPSSPYLPYPPPPPPTPPTSVRQPTEPLIDPFSKRLPAASGVAASSAAWATPAPAGPRALLPDDFDPFALPTAPRATTRNAAPATAAGTFDDLIPAASPLSIDDFFGLQPGSSDPLLDFMADAPQHRPDGADGTDPSPRLSGLSTDPMALFAGRSTPVAPSGARASHADDVPELRAAFVPPRPQAPPESASPPADAAAGLEPPWPLRSPADAAPTVEPRPVPAARGVPGAAPPPAVSRPTAPPADAAVADADPLAAWSAFCTGAGIAPELPPGTDPQRQLQLAGSLLHAAVAGALQLMMVRTTTKQELGADVTMIRARHNNPLKFSPDPTSALEQLLRPPLRGFLPGTAAMTDAMHDLVGHAIGTMAGTRAALEGVLDRFVPQQLEAQLTARSVLDSLLPMNRKAKLWELYLRHFDTIRNEAQEDFHALFGRAFLGAYQQQLDRLRQEDRDRAADPDAEKGRGEAGPGHGRTHG